MKNPIPIPNVYTDETSLQEEVIGQLNWTEDLLILLLNEAAPEWFRNGGKDLDLEHVATLRAAHRSIGETLSKLRAKENAANSEFAAPQES